MSPQTAASRVVLLFCHGGSFNKEIWGPILRWMRASPAFGRFAPHDIRAIDWRYHGEKSDHADLGRIVPSAKCGDDTAAGRVDHPMKDWPTWLPQDLEAEIRRIHQTHGDMETAVIGIGHSMGGYGLLRLEMAHPGTFHGIIAFEPVYNLHASGWDTMGPVMIRNALGRDWRWATWAEVEEHFATNKAYRNWHPASRAAFLEHGVRRADDGSYSLALAPTQDAAIYCQEVVKFSPNDFQRIQCPVRLEYGERTPLFHPSVPRVALDAAPDRFVLGLPIPNAGHNMVVENPTECARRIVDGLIQFPVMIRSH